MNYENILQQTLWKINQWIKSQCPLMPTERYMQAVKYDCLIPKKQKYLILLVSCEWWELEEKDEFCSGF
jgi:hypothetical protein